MKYTSLRTAAHIIAFIEKQASPTGATEITEAAILDNLVKVGFVILFESCHQFERLDLGR